MQKLAKITGSTFVGGMLVVGTAGVAFADGGHDGGPSQDPATSGTTQPGQDTYSGQGTQSGQDTQDAQTGQDAGTRSGQDQDSPDSQPPRTDTAQAPDNDSDGDGADPASTTSPSGARANDTAPSTSGTGGAANPSGPQSPATPLTPATTPSGTNGAASTTPPAFCADATMLHSWFAQREAAIARQITAAGAAEGAAAANGNTTAVRADRARIARLTGVESFLRSADAQLTSICGTA